VWHAMDVTTLSISFIPFKLSAEVAVLVQGHECRADAYVNATHTSHSGPQQHRSAVSSSDLPRQCGISQAQLF
jgi:hypothetical protein